ncbi:MAG: HAD hydrolase family protein, partial [Armatimonadota bacterium]|nr:HAD hydrolase family protein [Armatimonadota bacterium]
SQRVPVEAARWAAIKLLATDVDGVLTDGSLTFDENGSLLQTFHVRDGFGLVAARRAGLKIAWISGRPSAVAQKRFEELELDHCLLACADKAAALRDLQEQYGFTRDECCFIGDDLPDLPAFAMCGLSVAVADAVAAVAQRADYVTRARGGRGAVREVVELILSAQGHWDKLLEKMTRVDFAHPATENLQR